MEGQAAGAGMPNGARAWSPPLALDEWVKYRLVPGPAYIRFVAAKWAFRGEAELQLVRFLADPDKTSLDIGANEGVYSFVLRKHSAHVIAFEPNPKMARVLRSWAPGEGIDVRECALSNESGTATLRLPVTRRGYSNQEGSLSTTKVSGDYGEVTVRTARLDDLDLRDIGFMKIDVEGFEREVLEGARETIARERPTLLIEMEERHTKRAIEAQLADVLALGYHGYFLKRHRSLAPLSAFDPERDHRRPLRRSDYVFNFVFLPA